MDAGEQSRQRCGRRRAVAVLLLCAAPWRAAGSADLEDSVKAAYLYKFLGYVDWPAAALPADAPMTIGVVEADAVYQELSRVLPGRSVQGHAVVARRLQPGDSLEGLQALFIGREAELAQSPWLARAREHPVLVVTDNPQGLRHGGMLNFVLVQGKLRFEAAAATAEHSGLKLSSRLLAVAERVVNTP